MRRGLRVMGYTRRKTHDTKHITQDVKRRSKMALTVPKLIEKARKEISELTGLELSSTVGALKDEKGWHITVELIEKHSTPDQMDILASYEAVMDDDGNLLGFERKGMRRRMDTEVTE